MTLELAAQVDDPLLQSANAKGLRKYLARFGTDLGWEIFEPPVPGKKRRSRTNRFVVALAPAWQRLTGEDAEGLGNRRAEGAADSSILSVPPAISSSSIGRPSSTFREGYAPRARRKANMARGLIFG